MHDPDINPLIKVILHNLNENEMTYNTELMEITCMTATGYLTVILRTRAYMHELIAEKVRTTELTIFYYGLCGNPHNLT